MELIDKWIVGFVDGDGFFKIYQSEKEKRYCFVISQDKRSVSVLYALKKRFGCGSVKKAGQNMCEYRVTDKKHLIKIILPFFIENPLQTQKINDFKLFYQDLMGQSIVLKTTKSINPDWLTGFIDAEGCFSVSMGKDYPRPQLVISLHIRDKEILEHIRCFIGYGTVYEKKSKTGTYAVYQVSSLSGFVKITEICTTQKNRCLLKTMKRISYQKFQKIVRIILKKNHCSF